MRTINIHQAKTHLSRLVDEAEQGNSFIIAKAGKPKVLVTRLNVVEQAPTIRLGSMKGLFTLPDNFEEIDRELDQQVEALFLGEYEESGEDPGEHQR